MMKTITDKRLLWGLVVPTLILWLLVAILPPVGFNIIGEKYQFQSIVVLFVLEVFYLMCLGIIISTGIYLSVAIYFYLKHDHRFIQSCGGISIYGALLGCIVSLAVMIEASLSVFLPISIPIMIYFSYWVTQIKKQICIRKVCWITVMTLVVSIVVPVSCVYIFLY